MKKELVKRIIVTVATITIALGLFACGSKQNNNLENPSTITESTDITDSQTTENMSGTNWMMHEEKARLYKFDLESWKNIMDFEICDNYIIAIRYIDEKNKICIIDLSTDEEVKTYDISDGMLRKLDNGEILFYSYEGGGYIFHNISDEPDVLTEDELMKYSEGIWGEEKVIRDFDIPMVSVEQTYECANSDYIVTAYMDVDCKWWLPVYRASDNKLCYLDDILLDSNFSLSKCVIQDKLIFVSFYNYDTDETLLYCVEPGDEEISMPEVHGTYPDGITIFTGEDVILTETDGYIKETVNDEEKIVQIQNQLAAVFEKYPDGFWDELLYEGTYPRKSLVICLCGAIGNEGGYVDNPEGLAYFTNDTYFVLVDISNATEYTDYSQTFYHELMHTIDTALSDRNEMYEGWDELLPSGFEYNEAEQTEDNAMFFADSDDVYFVSSYGKTNQLEDRATLMAAMMDFGMEYYKDYDPMYKRMQYMDEMLRRNFRTIRECENPFWVR